MEVKIGYPGDLMAVMEGDWQGSSFMEISIGCSPEIAAQSVAAIDYRNKAYYLPRFETCPSFHFVNCFSVIVDKKFRGKLGNKLGCAIKLSPLSLDLEST